MKTVGLVAELAHRAEQGKPPTTPGGHHFGEHGQ
jgi:hypothetical protein